MAKKKLHRLSYKNRQTIEKMIRQEKPKQEIAAAVNVNLNTIYSELRRCPDGKYDALRAQLSLK